MRYKRGVIKLFQFPRPPKEWGVANASPFCMKVETYLKMTELPYEVVDTPDPRKSPKGKLPVIDDNGKMIPDSSAIIAHLKTAYGDKLDEDLSARDKAIAHALRRTMEEHLYFAVIYFRWIYEPGWTAVKSTIFASLPSVLKLFVPDLIRKNMAKTLHGQGIGRHSEAEIGELARQDLESISVVLGDKPYLLGDKPRSIDATGYGFLSSMTLVPLPSPLKTHAESFPNVVAYARRMREQFFLAKS